MKRAENHSAPAKRMEIATWPESRRMCCGLALLSMLLVGRGFEGAASGAAVRLEEKAGVWWFKSPDGKPFLSIGANHVEPVYWQSPNNRKFVLDLYGPGLFAPDGTFRDGSPAADKWARRVADNFKSWGFNTLGFHNPLSNSLHAACNAYYVVELGIRVPWGWNSPRSALLKAFKRYPLDVFGDAFAADVESNAAALVKPYADDPRVLGYAYTDGPPWTVDDDQDASLSVAEKTIHPWVLALMSLPAHAKGKQAWLALMKEKHSSPQKAAAVYVSKAMTWDELASTTVWKDLVDTAQAADDSRAFLEQIMRQWYQVRHRAIRKYDPNHLILGDKLNMNRDSRHPEQLVQSLKVMKPYVDLINIQYYGLVETQRDALALLYRETQMPILNGDTTFRPMWQDPDANGGEYYRQVGESYAGELRKLFALPYFVGWHHCGYMRGLRLPYVEAVKRGDQKTIDLYRKTRHTYREGFVSEFEEPVEPLLAPLTAAVAECQRLHRQQ